jgi:hypothetical protein
MTAVFHSNCICKNPKTKEQDIHKQQLARPAILKWNTRVTWNPNVLSVLGIFENNPFQFQTKRIQGEKIKWLQSSRVFPCLQQSFRSGFKAEKKIESFESKGRKNQSDLHGDEDNGSNQKQNSQCPCAPLCHSFEVNSWSDEDPFFSFLRIQLLMIVELSSRTSDASSEIE